MKFILTIVCLLGMAVSETRAATQTTEALGEIVSRRIEISGLSKTEFSCDASFYECRYRLNSLKIDPSFRRLLLPGKEYQSNYGFISNWEWARRAKFEDALNRSCEISASLVQTPSNDVDLVLVTCCRPSPDASCYDAEEKLFDRGLATLGSLFIEYDTVKEY